MATESTNGPEPSDGAAALGVLLLALRKRRGVSQVAAATAAHLQPQTVGRLEQAGSNPQIGTLTRYVVGLGYTMELVVRDDATGETVGRATLA